MYTIIVRTGGSVSLAVPLRKGRWVGLQRNRCGFSCVLLEEDPDSLVTRMSTFLRFATHLLMNELLRPLIDASSCRRGNPHALASSFGAIPRSLRVLCVQWRNTSYLLDRCHLKYGLQRSGPWQITQLEDQIVMAGFQAFSFVFVAGPF